MMSLNVRPLPCALCLLPLALGCSESVAPASQGAWAAGIVAGGDVNKTCPAGGKNEAVGSVSATTHAELVKDTVDGAEVFCSVVPSGSGFDVRGRASWQGKTMEFQVNGLVKDIPAGATETAPVMGTVMIQTANTQLSLTSSQAGEQCGFYMNSTQVAQLDNGKAWLSFNDCYVENSGVTPAQRCKLIQGFVAFQNCDDGATD